MKSKIVLSVAICLIGCTSVQPDVFQYNIAIDPVAVDQPEYESIVESIEYIPLETKDNALIGEANDLYVSNGKVYINSDRKKVLCFDEHGNFLFNIGHVGRGKGEYISPYSISIDNGLLYVLCQHTGRLLCYDALSGIYLNTITLPNKYMQAVVSNGFVYAVDMVSKPFAIDAIPLDNPNNKSEVYCAAKGEYIYTSFKQLFQSSEGWCYWVDPLRGRIYELKNGGMIPFMDLDFGQKEHQDKALLSGEYTSNNEMVSAVSDFYRIGDKCVLTFMGGDGDMHTLLIDLKYNKVVNLGSMNYRKVQYPESIYKRVPRGVIAADKRFYQVQISMYHDPGTELPEEYASYNRMKGRDPKKDNITLIALDLK
jgi:hypothetical protein